MPAAVTHASEYAKLESLLDGQKRILAMINEDHELAEILAEICLVVEKQTEGMIVAILLLDKEGKHLLHGAAPSLPKEYCDAVHGMTIGPETGSCGTAAFTNEPCFVEDIATHPYWASFRGIAYVQHGLRACWSTPIRAYDGSVLGTFALYYREPKLPTLHERKLIDFTGHLVSIALNRHRQVEQLRAALAS